MLGPQLSVQSPVVAIAMTPRLTGEVSMGPAPPSSQRPLPLSTMEESLELQGHHRLGNGAGVKVLFGDSLGIPDLNHSSQAPIPGWISGAETDVHGTAWGAP